MFQKKRKSLIPRSFKKKAKRHLDAISINENTIDPIIEIIICLICKEPELGLIPLDCIGFICDDCVYKNPYQSNRIEIGYKINNYLENGRRVI